MKTIYTCLPIYDKIAKQCFERAAHAKTSGYDKVVPTITPRHRLPSFQWLDDGDGAASVSKIEMIGDGYTGAEVALATGWAASSYGTFTTNGLEILSAISAGLSSASLSPNFTTIVGEKIRFRGTLTRNSGAGTEPQYLHTYSTAPEPLLSVGANDILLTATNAGSNTGLVLNAGASNWSLSNVSITRINDLYDITGYFPTLPALYTDGTSTWFTYDGDTLNYLLPEGLYYLKITMNNGVVYYSDWFLVDCVFENLITGWVNDDYDTFTTSGTKITSAIEAGVNANANSTPVFSVVKGEVVTVILNFTKNSGQFPSIELYDATLGVISNQVALISGLNTVVLTATNVSDAAYIVIYNTTASNWITTEIIVIRAYSEKYLKIDYNHSCNLGDIYYEGGLIQTLFLESETMEPVFPYTEKGAENGYGQFVPTWQRQEKNQLIRTNLIPSYIVEVLHRLKLHDTITLIDLVGDEFTVEEIDTEHDWQFDDKYYALAKVTVDLGETIIVTGCCTAVNVC